MYPPKIYFQKKVKVKIISKLIQNNANLINKIIIILEQTSVDQAMFFFLSKTHSTQCNKKE